MIISCYKFTIKNDNSYLWFTLFSFHVVEWAMTALDEVRKDIWHDAYSEYKQVKKDNPRGKGRPKKDDPELAIVKAAKAKADEIKGSAYALGRPFQVLCKR